MTAPLTVLAREEAERSADKWGRKSLLALDAMWRAMEDGRRTDAAHYADWTSRYAVYAATCGRIALDAKEAK